MLHQEALCHVSLTYCQRCNRAKTVMRQHRLAETRPSINVENIVTEALLMLFCATVSLAQKTTVDNPFMDLEFLIDQAK